VRSQFRRVGARAGVRRRFAPRTSIEAQKRLDMVDVAFSPADEA
jgi:hypothetical protein